MDLFDDSDLMKPPFDFPGGDGYSYTWSEDFSGFEILIPQGRMFYSESYFSRKVSDRCVDYFLENEVEGMSKIDLEKLAAQSLDKIPFSNIAWKQESIRLYGRTVPLPRITAWYGDASSSYTYSGIKLAPEQWNKGLLYIKREVERVAGVKFNSVLMNWYRNGEDYLNWHADDEKELGENPVIASANFGAKRDFIIRRTDNSKEKIGIPLGHGSLLIMSGEMQHHWQHSVPKRKKVSDSRFNLTFRVIK